jgi:hypothetical protein
MRKPMMDHDYKVWNPKFKAYYRDHLGRDLVFGYNAATHYARVIEQTQPGVEVHKFLNKSFLGVEAHDGIGSDQNSGRAESRSGG